MNIFKDIRIRNAMTRPQWVYVAIFWGSLVGGLGSAYAYYQDPWWGAEVITAGYIALFIMAFSGLMRSIMRGER